MRMAYLLGSIRWSWPLKRYVVVGVDVCSESERSIETFGDVIFARLAEAQGEDFEEAKKNVLSLARERMPDLLERLMPEERCDD